MNVRGGSRYCRRQIEARPQPQNAVAFVDDVNEAPIRSSTSTSDPTRTARRRVHRTTALSRSITDVVGAGALRIELYWKPGSRRLDTDAQHRAVAFRFQDGPDSLGGSLEIVTLVAVSVITVSENTGL